MTRVSAAAPNRPNIVWLTLEDTSPQFIGCYGNAQAHTPSIDDLARRGLRFTRAYSTGTVCAPSRSTLITGVCTTELGTGHHRSEYPIPDFITGFPAQLRAAGYYTSNNVKTDYNTSAHDRIVAESWDECSASAGWWNRHPGQPFFSVFNFMQSHQSWTMSLPYDRYVSGVVDLLETEDRTNDTSFTMPPFLRDSPAMRRQFARVYNSLTLTDHHVGAVLARLADDDLLDDTIIMTFADHGEGIPRGKTNGIGLGYRVPMIVAVPPKWQHLCPWEPGTTVSELVSFEDLPPTVLDLAGVPKPAYMTGRVVFGHGRHVAPEYRHGNSDRSDETTTLERTVFHDRYVYTRHFLPFVPEAAWCKYHDIADIRVQMRRDLADGLLNTCQHRLFDRRPNESLYDLDDDPWEERNLAPRAEYRPLLSRLRTELVRHLLERRDVMLLPEYDLVRAGRHSTPYTHRLDAKAYPVEKVVRAAMLVGESDEESLDAQLTLLHDDVGAVRYWAAAGLRCAVGQLPARAQEALHAALRDQYPPVQVVAAATCWLQGRDESAARVLRTRCLDSDPAIAQMALQQIQLMDDVRPFADAVKSLAAGKGAHDAYNLGALTDMLRWRLGHIDRPVPPAMMRRGPQVPPLPLL